MTKDIHPYLGPKIRTQSIETALGLVRHRYPNFYIEGSTGFERNFWVDRELVAHAFPIRGSTDFWLRIRE